MAFSERLPASFAPISGSVRFAHPPQTWREEDVDSRCFLEEFAGEGPWAHGDIAGPAFLERSRGDYMSQRGGTGYGVRLIVELATRLSA